MLRFDLCWLPRQEVREPVPWYGGEGVRKADLGFGVHYLYVMRKKKPVVGEGSGSAAARGGEQHGGGGGGCEGPAGAAPDSSSRVRGEGSPMRFERELRDDEEVEGGGSAKKGGRDDEERRGGAGAAASLD